MNESSILLYETDEGKINVDVILKDETMWLTQKSMAELFDCSSDNISLHLKNIFDDSELDRNSTTEKISVVRKEVKKQCKQNFRVKQDREYILSMDEMDKKYLEEIELGEK